MKLNYGTPCICRLTNKKSGALIPVNASAVDSSMIWTVLLLSVIKSKNGCLQGRDSPMSKNYS
jgi:hypothetical protein